MIAKRYRLHTFGCQMNKSDSERLAALLDSLGFVETANDKEADLVVMNSCSVRQSAEDRIFGRLRALGRLRAKRPGLLVAVTGCLPGRDHDGRLRAKMPEADLFFPTRDMVQLPRWLAELRPEWMIGGDAEADYLKIRPRYSSEYQAFVTVQTGCNMFCSYCVVPYARGLEKNRPLAGIMGEVKDLAAKGVVEITLLGQSINSWKAPDRAAFSPKNPYKSDFAALLWEVNQVPGIERVHIVGAQPLHMDDETIDALTLPKQLNFLHLPIQAGSDDVLKKMNRRYTAARYLDIIRRVREKRPGIAIGSDIIVGFCGETLEDFKKTLDVYRQADLDISYNAIYSPRSGTMAAKLWADDVPRDEKKRRWQELQQLMEETVLRKNQAYVGKTAEVLVDDHGDGWCGGNSREMKLVRFHCSEDLRGKIVPIKVTQALAWMLTGTVIGN